MAGRYRAICLGAGSVVATPACPRRGPMPACKMRATPGRSTRHGSLPPPPCRSAVRAPHLRQRGCCKGGCPAGSTLLVHGRGARWARCEACCRCGASRQANEAHLSQRHGCLAPPLLPGLPDHALPLSPIERRLLCSARCRQRRAGLPPAALAAAGCGIPSFEAAHYSCPSFGLGLVHGRLSAAAQALRDGASGDEAKRLLRLSADKTCTGRGKGRI